MLKYLQFSIGTIFIFLPFAHVISARNSLPTLTLETATFSSQGQNVRYLNTSVQIPTPPTSYVCFRKHSSLSSKWTDTYLESLCWWNTILTYIKHLESCLALRIGCILLAIIILYFDPFQLILFYKVKFASFFSVELFLSPFFLRLPQELMTPFVILVVWLVHIVFYHCHIISITILLICLRISIAYLGWKSILKVGLNSFISPSPLYA